MFKNIAEKISESNSKIFNGGKNIVRDENGVILMPGVKGNEIVEKKESKIEPEVIKAEEVAKVESEIKPEKVSIELDTNTSKKKDINELVVKELGLNIEEIISNVLEELLCSENNRKDLLDILIRAGVGKDLFNKEDLSKIPIKALPYVSEIISKLPDKSIEQIENNFTNFEIMIDVITLGLKVVNNKDLLIKLLPILGQKNTKLNRLISTLKSLIITIDSISNPPEIETILDTNQVIPKPIKRDIYGGENYYRIPEGQKIINPLVSIQEQIQNDTVTKLLIENANKYDDSNKKDIKIEEVESEVIPEPENKEVKESQVEIKEDVNEVVDVTEDIKDTKTEEEKSEPEKNNKHKKK